MQATIHEYRENGFEIMSGSTGVESYLVFAQHPETGARIGIKPLVGGVYVGGKKAIAITPRIRADHPREIAIDEVDTAAGGHISKAKHDGMADLDVPGLCYPKTPWSKSDGDRASVIIGAIYRRDEDTIHMVTSDLENTGFYRQITNLLAAWINPEHWIVDPAQVQNFVRDCIHEELAGKGKTKEALLAKAKALEETIEQMKKRIAAIEKDKAAILASAEGLNAVEYVEVVHPAPNVMTMEDLAAVINAPGEDDDATVEADDPEDVDGMLS